MTKLHVLLDSILKKYGNLETLGHKVTTRIMNRMSSSDPNLQTTIDCLVSKLKSLRGNLNEDVLELLLNKVDRGELSLVGLEQECRKIKEIKDLQRHLLEQSACKSWDEAKQRKPANRKGRRRLRTKHVHPCDNPGRLVCEKKPTSISEYK